MESELQTSVESDKLGVRTYCKVAGLPLRTSLFWRWSLAYMMAGGHFKHNASAGFKTKARKLLWKPQLGAEW